MEKETNKKLLYDPMFERYEQAETTDKKKTLIKKIVFVITLSFFVGISMFLSFSSISGNGADYEQNENGYSLISYKSNSANTVLRADFTVNEQGEADTSAPVTKIGKYTLCCDEYTEYIYIGKSVSEIETNAFYYCKNLKAVFVHEENENYASVNGALYKKENGQLTEIILCPMQNTYFSAAVSSDFSVPASFEEAEEYIAEIRNNSEEFSKKYEESEKIFTISEGVTKIADMCFNSCFDIEEIIIPESVKEIGSMAFFRCESLKALNLPDGIETIGSDAFTKCVTLSYLYIPSSVREIGHHAFYDCSGLDQVNLGHKDESALTTGENWLPQKRDILMKDIPAVYGQERSE